MTELLIVDGDRALLAEVNRARGGEQR